MTTLLSMLDGAHLLKLYKCLTLDKTKIIRTIVRYHNKIDNTPDGWLLRGDVLYHHDQMVRKGVTSIIGLFYGLLYIVVNGKLCTYSSGMYGRKYYEVKCPINFTFITMSIDGVILSEDGELYKYWSYDNSIEKLKLPELVYKLDYYPCNAHLLDGRVVLYDKA